MVVTVSLVFVLSMLVTAWQVAPSPPAIQLLAFTCVELDSGSPAVVELEREEFPPFADTGLFFANGQVIAYVEQGSLTIFGDQIGRALGEAGTSVVAGAGASLGVRNEGLTAGSVLWARIVPAVDRSQAAMSITAPTLRAEQSLPAAVPVGDEPILPPLYFEFDLPEFDPELEEPHLFLVKMELDSSAMVDADGDEALTTTGIAGIIVESGTVLVDQGENEELTTRTLHTGEGMTVDGQSAYAVNPADSAATVFLIGVIGKGDTGRVGTEIANAPTRDRICPTG